MEPRRVRRAGRELGNAAAAALICVDPRTGKAIKPSTYQWYVAQGKPAGNKAPGHVEVDSLTSQRLYPLAEVRAWHKARRGRGNWGGIGAKARKHPEPIDGQEPGMPAIVEEPENVDTRAER